MSCPGCLCLVIDSVLDPGLLTADPESFPSALRPGELSWSFEPECRVIFLDNKKWVRLLMWILLCILNEIVKKFSLLGRKSSSVFVNHFMLFTFRKISSYEMYLALPL